MYSHTVFQEVMKALPRTTFEKIRRHTCPQDKARAFSHWSHLNAMLYCQVVGAESLRRLTFSLKQHYAHYYHLGIKEVKRSTLSYANNHRDVTLFSHVLQHLIQQRQKGPSCQEIIRLIDSSPIPLDPQVFGSFSQHNNRLAGGQATLGI